MQKKIEKINLVILFFFIIQNFIFGMQLSKLPPDIQARILHNVPKEEWWYCERNLKYGREDTTISSVSWHPDGMLLAITTCKISYRDKTEIYKNNTEIVGIRESIPVKFLNDYIAGQSVAWHPKGKLVAIGGESKNATIVSIDINQSKVEEYAPLSFIGSVDGWSSQGVFLTAYWFDNQLRIINVEEEKTEKIFTKEVESIAWNPCKDILAKKLMSGDVELVNMTTGDVEPFGIIYRIQLQEKLFKNTSIKVRSIGWHPNGEFLIIGACDGIVGIVDVITRQLKPYFHMEDTIRSIAWHPRENCFAMGVGDTVKIFKKHDYNLDQLRLKCSLLTWLLIEKPSKKMTTRWKLLRDVAIKCGWDAYIFDVWKSFPELMQDALWRTMEYRIVVHGKNSKKRVVPCIIQ